MKNITQIPNKNIISLLLLFLTVFLFFFPVIFEGKNLLIDPYDHVLTYLRMVETASFLSSLCFPLWNPGIFSGSSYIDTVPTAHVLNLQPWVMSIFGNTFGYILCVMLFVLFGAFGTYIFCYKRLKINWQLSLCAGVSVAFGPFIGNTYSSIFVLFPFISFFLYFFSLIFYQTKVKSIVTASLCAIFPIAFCFYTQEPRFLEFIFYSTILFSINMFFIKRDNKQLIFKNILIFTLIFGTGFVLMALPVLLPLVLNVFHNQYRLGAGQSLPGIFSFPPLISLLDSFLGNFLPINTLIFHDNLRLKLFGDYFTLYFHYIHILFIPAFFIAIFIFKKLNAFEKCIILTGLTLKLITTIYTYIPGFMHLWTRIFRTGRFIGNDIVFFYGVVMVFIVLNEVLFNKDLKFSYKQKGFLNLLFNIQAIIIFSVLILVLGLQLLKSFPNFSLFLNCFSKPVAYLKYLYGFYSKQFLYLVTAFSSLIFQLFFLKIKINSKFNNKVLTGLFIAALFVTPFLFSRAYWPFNNLPDRSAIYTDDRKFLASLNILDRTDAVDFGNCQDCNKNERGGVIPPQSNRSLKWTILTYQPGMCSLMFHFVPVEMHDYFVQLYKDSKYLNNSEPNRLYFYPSDNNLFHLLGVNYFFSELDIFYAPFKKIGKFGDYYVYKNEKAVPRYYFADTISTLNSLDILREIIALPYDEMKKNAFISSEDQIKLFGKGRYSDESRDVKLIIYAANEVVLSTESLKDQFLVLNDTFDLKWKVYIDGVESIIYRTNYLFRGVEVPSGRHTVRFKYHYPEFKVYLITAFCAVLACLCIIAILRHEN
jgi:hypothetical protein